MKLSIGESIRALRRERGITQLQLAERIGISTQAVSKWECGLALPDIALIPRLAEIFGVSTDTLFSYDRQKIDAEVETAVNAAARLRESDPEKGRAILEEALKRYPDNEILQNNLLYVMDWTKDPDGTILLARRLADSTADSGIRYDALRFLAYAWDAKGDNERAVAALEQIPEIYFTKLSEMAFVAEGECKRAAAEKQKWLSLEMLIQMMAKLAECREADGERTKAAQQYRRALSVIEVLEDEVDPAAPGFGNYKEYFTRQIDRLEK